MDGSRERKLVQIARGDLFMRDLPEMLRVSKTV